mmetsp:Transcript_23954/g.66967  ORF Transcript_23954/g.66967 Transcript_23954/m.66967 type:complete len:223 (-) Transcript_23954:378-1046(-)
MLPSPCCIISTGGAIISSPNEAVIASVGKVYAGRASSTPIIDLFITLLSMGLNGYQRLLENRQRMLPIFSKRLAEVAEKYGERILHCPSNTISYGITLDTLYPTASAQTTTGDGDDHKEGEKERLKSASKQVSALGAMLFSRCVSGTRVVPLGQHKVMGGHDFVGFGSSHHDFPHAYMTAACAIGLSTAEMNEFFQRLDKTMKEYKKKIEKQRKKEAGEAKA